MDMRVRYCLEVPGPVGQHIHGHVGGDGQMALRDHLVANYDRLHRRLRRHFGCPDRASDCLHDAWLRLGDMPVPASLQHPEAYLYRVACNLAIDQLRGNRSTQCLDDAHAELDVVADPCPGPDLIAEARSEVEAVDRAVGRLPRRHRAVLMALRIDELTRHEVAALHGISLRRVDTVLRQALDYCAGQTGLPVLAGIRSPRRALPQERMHA